MRNVDFSAFTTRMSLRFRAYAVSTGAALAFMAGLAGVNMDNNETTSAAATEPTTAAALENPGAAPAAAAPAEAVPAPAPANPPAPTDTQLHPVGIAAAQQAFEPSAEQLANAKAIVEAGKALNLPPRAWVIAVATAIAGVDPEEHRSPR